MKEVRFGTTDILKLTWDLALHPFLGHWIEVPHLEDKLSAPFPKEQNELIFTF